MLRLVPALRRNRLRHISLFLATVLLLPATPTVFAGNCGFFRNNAVGGVSIDPTGVVRVTNVVQRDKLVANMREDIKPATGAMNEVTSMRMVSLRGLESAIRERGLKDLPEEFRYLAGMQRIEYVFLYPEQNDIVLAGPGEGWKVDDKANVVGITTGRPVLLLDDLLVAFRTADDAGRGQGISCSIDPTAEGRRQFQAYIDRVKTIRGFNAKQAAEAMGMQRITITGAPADSHYARVMVAADYRMKRYAMDLEEAPIKGLPSFLDLLKKRRGKVTNAMPRWWLACHYEPVLRSEDGLAWQLQGPGVKVMTEDDFVSAEGNVAGAGRTNPIAQEWANLFTAKYDELTAADPVFRDLRNIMDMSVVAALIQRHKLLKKAGLQLPSLAGESSELTHDQWHTPKNVATSCSTMKIGREYAITASGGVQVESWQIAGRNKIDVGVKKKYAASNSPAVSRRWWN